MAKAKISPMMDQYFQIKKDYADVILFFRLGDFYEMFFDDAKIASKELDLVLTGRGAPAAVLARADLVTEMRAVRHYYDRGVAARVGIEK